MKSFYECTSYSYNKYLPNNRIKKKIKNNLLFNVSKFKRLSQFFIMNVGVDQRIYIICFNNYGFFFLLPNSITFSVIKVHTLLQKWYQTKMLRIEIIPNC